MARPKRKGYTLGKHEIRRRFFEGVFHGCPEILRSLKNEGQPLYQQLPKSEVYLPSWVEILTSERAEDPKSCALARAARQWMEMYHLPETELWIGQFAVEILYVLEREPDHQALGLGWYSPTITTNQDGEIIEEDWSYFSLLRSVPRYLDRVQPKSITIPVPRPLIHRGETRCRYEERVLRAARDILPSLIREITSEIWEAAVRAHNESLREDDAVVICTQLDDSNELLIDQLKWAATARYICLNEDLEQTTKWVASRIRSLNDNDPPHKSTVWRWIKENAAQLGWKPKARYSRID